MPGAASAAESENRAPREPERALDRFLAINADRLSRIRASLSSRQADFLDVLPLLFHNNHPRLPGFVSASTPSGLKDFSPDEVCLKAAKKIARFSTETQRAHRTLDIESIFFIGSVGTIAHSEHSDFDIWVCHATNLSEQGVAELQRKGAAIQAWAASLHLEVHFFIFDAPGFRSGAVQSLSSESSGSTQHALLLDEFYRSGVLVAGLPPAWWSVPPDEEDLYQQRIEKLDNHVDFGHIEKAPAEEFFGASLWQLYKSVQSPFKSVLKLLLMEVYADSYPNTQLLSADFKKAVYGGETDSEQLDPYVRMYRACERYLLEKRDENRLDLLRRSFYLKVALPLSRSEDDSWRAQLLRKLVDEWRWDHDKLMLLDAVDAWKLETVRKENHALMHALTKSYRHLSEFARSNSEIARITQQDLAILGRKLYAAFERKAGKLDLLNRGLALSLYERSVSIHYISSHSGDSWLLFRGFVTPAELDSSTPLERGYRLFELLAWCHFNKVMNRETNCALYGTSAMSVKDVQGVLAALHRHYPCGDLPPAAHEDLTQPARITNLTFFINVGLLARSSRLYGETILTTEHTDALCFGGLHDNLIESIDIVYTNSWEEVFTNRFAGTTGLLECLCEIMRLSREDNAPILRTARVYCFAPGYSSLVSRRFESLIAMFTNLFKKGAGDSEERLCLKIEETFYVLEVIGGEPSYTGYADSGALLRLLTTPNARFRDTLFDEGVFDDDILPFLYQTNKKNVIQVFIVPRSQSLAVYVLDECGTLFTQTVEKNDIGSLVEHYRRFFSSLHKRFDDKLAVTESKRSHPRVDFHRLSWDEESGYRLHPLTPPEAGLSANYFSLQVLASTDERNKTIFDIYCDDRRIASEGGTDLFNTVAQHVLEQRKSGLSYPIYITDLDLNQTLGDERPTQTAVFLQHKRTIERKLLQALRSLRP